MNSGMYSALSGNIAAMKRLDIISNNLANVNTPGYKKEKMTFESMLAGSVNPPAVPQGSTADPILQKENVYIDYSAGPIAQTGNPLDVSIDGDGFFVVNTPDGQAYTRQGNFRLAADGTLVTSDGHTVLGQGGAIQVQGGKVEIDAKGVVSVDGTPAGTISIVDFPKPYNLTKVGKALFVPGAQANPQAAQSAILQGQLEGSNVDTISEMVQMIETTRYFEACSKVIKGYDDMATKATNDLGRL
ncbi:flagellar basal-body rod protein FlgF [Geobacter sp. SVR]|uniref:flagellar basal-body rod protein FlgF n=1 Tax=Geobacter sp. SVR TaxID=2495594 RepID=UPI00143EF598|nr:flagellar basal-body rod protein FlgF [Geobacter sp. SVR]BCS55806.1 flagellar basal-body rod protein FlgF [Geobacter sp. SVR]GCF83810.1 flagellar basal-body rod protein FlgF [Geobacter sp. SVR]